MLKSTSASSRSTKASRTLIEALPDILVLIDDFKCSLSADITKFSNSLNVIYPLLSLSYSFMILEQSLNVRLIPEFLPKS